MEASMSWVLLLASIFALTTPPVQSAWTMQIRLVHYKNPGNVDFNYICCDPFTLCIKACDVYFSFCIRAINTDPTSTNCGQDHYATTRGYPITATEIYPPTTGPLYQNSPLNNPIQFTGNRWSGSFQLLVSTEDADTDADDLIDRNPFNQVMSPTGVWTETIAVQGIYNVANVAVQFRLFCNRYYYTDSCDVYCQSRDDSQGHYDCNSDGTKRCLSGWTDPDSNCLTAICASGCANGHCDLPGQCLCDSGWTGEKCDVCFPKSGCSQEHGSCNLPGECNCDTGYGGPNCDQDLDVCGHQQPCLHGATCNNEGADQHSCLCAPGYTGDNCQSDINECEPLPCLNGATCIDRVSDFECQCAPGWTGHTCNKNIDDCDPSPCDNGGTCTDLVDGFKCECPAGFLEPDCEGHQCDHDPCENGGTCMNTTDGFDCVCILGYTGFNCSEEADECDPSPCENGGSCNDMFADYNCTCPSGFTGKNCQFNIDDCINADCSPHSICVDGIDSYTCLCNQGYTGTYCEITIDYCAPPLPCQNGATCISYPSGFLCHCAPGYSGVDCDTETDHCVNSSCLNNGTCNNLPLTYTCTCPSEWTGSHCEDQVSACESNPCLEGQSCVDTGDTYFCQICTIDDGCKVVQPIIDVSPTPSSTPQESWQMITGIVVGVVILLLLCFFLLLVIMIVCKMRKSRQKSLYVSIEPEDRHVHENPTYVSPRELVASKSYSSSTSVELPLVTHVTGDYGSSPAASNLAPKTSSTLIGRSGKYDRLAKPAEDGESAATQLLSRSNED